MSILFRQRQRQQLRQQQQQQQLTTTTLLIWDFHYINRTRQLDRLHRGHSNVSDVRATGPN